MDDLQIISSNLDDLYNLFGVNEDIQTVDLLDFIIENQYSHASDLIAWKLGLPLKTSLEIINIKNDTLTEHKVAEVIIPANLPFYGSAALNNFPIHIRLMSATTLNIDTFIAVITHELSHILLASIKSPLSKNEKYVDLCPILLGFKEVIRRGRIKQHNASLKTVYGYLTNEEFDYAYCKVGNYICEFQKKKEKLISQLEKIKKENNRNVIRLQDQVRLTHQFDKRQERKIGKEDLQFIIDLHNLNYRDNYFNELNNTSYQIDELIQKINAISHYSNSIEDYLPEFQRKINLLCSEVESKTKIISNENQKLISYLNSLEKLHLKFKKTSQK